MSSSFANGLGRSYSITSSARASGIARRNPVPSVLRLSVVSYLVGRRRHVLK